MPLQAHGVKVVLDLGGDDKPPPKELLAAVDIIAPNGEASSSAGVRAELRPLDDHRRG